VQQCNGSPFCFIRFKNFNKLVVVHLGETIADGEPQAVSNDPTVVEGFTPERN